MGHSIGLVDRCRSFTRSIEANICLGECIATMRGHDDEVLDVVFDSTGQYIATASADKTGRVYDALNQLCIATLSGHQAEISKIVFNPQGNRLITASE